MKRFKPWILFASLTVYLIIVFIQCRNTTNRADQVEAEPFLYAGSQSCVSCHSEISKSHRQTAHFLSMRPANIVDIMGSFQDGQNTFSFRPGLKVAMEKTDNSAFQVAYVDGQEQRRERFDIITGSGKKGQTYLYWKNGRLFQLPVTYFSQAKKWSNSPGFPGRAKFNRPITSRCLECHTTYAKTTSNNKNSAEEFDPKSIVYGIDCEKCHGAAQKHVVFHEKNPKETQARFILNSAHFTREQKLDACALCHGGRLSKTKPSFTFQPGDKLADFFKAIPVVSKVEEIDVHGNQYTLLANSACFKMSKMDCSTCHNVHINETSQIEVFSQRCQSCHNQSGNKFCKVQHVPKTLIQKNCIDCHMPKVPSKAVAFLLEGAKELTPAILRTHFISIYPDKTSQVLQTLGKQSNKKK